MESTSPPTSTFAVHCGTTSWRVIRACKWCINHLARLRTADETCALPLGVQIATMDGGAGERYGGEVQGNNGRTSPVSQLQTRTVLS